MVDVAHDGDDRRARQHLDVARGREQLFLELVFLERESRVWPNSSTTSVAVSWSMGWLIVAITPIFIIA